MSEFNDKIIAEFRAHNGKVGPPFEGAPMVLLTTIGAKSGAQLVTPLVYKQEGDHIVVFASAAGAPKHPAWYHNLVSNPEVTVELPGETFEARASTLTGDERTRIWTTQKEAMPGFKDYEEKTDREIPVVVLERNG